MEENKNTCGKKDVLFSVGIFFATLVAVVGAGYLKKWNMTQLISSTVFTAMGMGILFFLTAFCREQGLYEHDNEKQYGRFCVVYLAALALAVACAFLPMAGWPFLVIFVCLSLFGNMMIGLTAGTFLLFLTVLLSGQGIVAFMMYFFCGVAGICLFDKLDENYKIGIPLTVSILMLIVAQTAGVVLYANEKLRLELFIVPFLNVIVSTILLIVFLKVYSVLVIYRYREKYLVINDQECPLLTQLKQVSREEYYRAVHTAYFCDRIAKRLQLDAEAAKTAGYYHRIGTLKGECTWEKTEDICREYEFPPYAVQILREFLDQKTIVRSKETAVLVFSDTVITAILFLIKKQPDVVPDYGQIVDTVFRKKLESGMLVNCRISLEELTVMKNIFKEEKLYYDFLR